MSHSSLNFAPVPLASAKVETQDHWMIVTELEGEALPPLPPGLRSLSLHDCADLRDFSLESAPVLEFLRVRNPPNLVRLPSLPPTLKWLCIVNCPLLRELPPLPDGLESLVCSACERLEVLPPLPASLKTLVGAGCPLAVPMGPNPLGLETNYHTDPSWIVYNAAEARDYARRLEAWRLAQ